MIDVMFSVMLMAGCALSMFLGQGGEMSRQLLTSAQQAVETVLGMCGSFAFFCGIMAIVREAGVMKRLAQWMHRPLQKLFGSTLQEEAMESVSMNLAANMLGMGNAATPMGIRAVQQMAKGDTATNAVCLFLVINVSSVQLLPTTMLSLRAAAGSVMPSKVLWPSLIATAASTLAGVVSCKVLEKWF